MSKNSTSLFTIAILCLVASWGLKQCGVSVATYGLAGSLARESIRADKAADIAAASLDVELLEAEETPDEAAITAAREEAKKEIEEIEKEYKSALIEARVDSANGASWGFFGLRLFLNLKLILDLLKIVGIALLFVSTLGMVKDETLPTPLRIFGVASCSVALFAILVSGILGMIS